MAHQRAPLASHALEDIQVKLTPIRDRRTPVEPPSASEQWADYNNGVDVHIPLPEPSSAFATFVKQAIPAEPAFPSVAKASAKDRLVSYSVRLKLSQIERLEELKAERGIVPSELLRDFIDRCLPQV